MKISSYVSSLIDLLHDEFRSRPKGAIRRVGPYYDYDTGRGEHATAGGFAINELSLLMGGLKVSAGANCMALVLSDVVIKWYMNPRGNIHNSNSDRDLEAFHNACDRGWEMHFAETMMIRGFLVQERILPAADAADLGLIRWSHIDNHQKLVDEIGTELDIDDLHNRNWGYRPNDTKFELPVIFDYSDYQRA